MRLILTAALLLAGIVFGHHAEDNTMGDNQPGLNDGKDRYTTCGSNGFGDCVPLEYKTGPNIQPPGEKLTIDWVEASLVVVGPSGSCKTEICVYEWTKTLEFGLRSDGVLMWREAKREE